MPGKKIIYRLLGRAGFPLADLMILGKGTPSSSSSSSLLHSSLELIDEKVDEP